MSIFGADTQAVRLLFIIVILLILAVAAVILWINRLRKDEKEIMGLLKILMRLDKREIEHLRKSGSLSAEQKELIADVKSLKETGLTKKLIMRIKPKKTAIKEVMHKINMQPVIEGERKIMAGIKKKISQGLKALEKSTRVFGKGLENQAYKLEKGTANIGKKMARGSSAMKKSGKRTISEVKEWTNSKAAKLEKMMEGRRREKTRELRMKEAEERKEEKAKELKKSRERKEEIRLEKIEQKRKQQAKEKKDKELKAIIKELKERRKKR